MVRPQPVSIAAPVAQPVVGSVCDPPELADCVARMARGDREALSLLFDRQADRVHAIAFRLLRVREDAEEVVSDVFLQAWRQAASFEPARGRVESWLLRIAYSRSIDCIRRRRAGERACVHPSVTDASYGAWEPAATDPSASALVEAYEAGSAVRACLAALGEQQRRLIALGFMEGLSHQEIALRTGLPIGTVKSHMRRGLRALRRQLEVAGYAND